MKYLTSPVWAKFKVCKSLGPYNTFWCSTKSIAESYVRKWGGVIVRVVS